MFLLLLTGCIFSERPEVPEDRVPTVEPVAVAADPTTAEPDTQAQPAPITPQPELVSATNEDVAMAVARAQSLMDRATTPAQVATAYGSAVGAAEAVTLYGQDHFSYENKGDVDTLAAMIPWLGYDWMAEGTVAVFQPDAQAWTAKAATTEGTADDAFFDLLTFVYDAASDIGYPVYNERNWDYGGCSGLGTGTVVETLIRTDRALAAGDAFTGRVQKERAKAIKEITRPDDSLFQLCNPNTNAPSDTAALQAEAQRVLDEVNLTDAEREAITAAKPRLKGEAFSGG